MVNSHLYVFDLERWWKFDGSLLQSTFDTYIESKRVRIHFPSKVDAHRLRMASLGSPRFESRLGTFPDGIYGQTDFWGRATALSTSGAEILSFETHVMAIEAIGEDDFFQPEAHDWARRKLNPWCASVTDWLEYLANQVSEMQARNRNSPMSKNLETWTWVDKNWLEPYRTVEINCGVGLGNEAWGSGASRDEFEIALRSVEENQSPPVEHILLSASRTSFLSREYRKAVLEGAVSLEGMLRQLLIDFDAHKKCVRISGEREEIEKMSLGRLIECATSIIPHWPVEVGTDIAQIRNIAAHQNIEVTKNEASLFLTKVTRVVNQYSPKTQLRFIPSPDRNG